MPDATRAELKDLVRRFRLTLHVPTRAPLARVGTGAELADKTVACSAPRRRAARPD